MNKYNLALEVLKILNKNGFEAYIVGGFPRDYYLGIVSDDIDICTNAVFNDLKEIFDSISYNKYGSYLLSYKDNSFEVTTYRKDIRSFKSRFPMSIKFVNKLYSDLKRRDFTINTLCIDCNGNFLDLMNSRIDINHCIIKIVGSKKKMRDDSLRILRAIRFATILNFDIDLKLRRAILKYSYTLQNLSFDRKKSELDKIFLSNNCSYGINLIRYYGLEDYLHIDLSDVVIVDDLCGMWAQVIIDDSYNFKKSDKYKITKIRELLWKLFDIYDLYLYGCDILSVVSKIKGDGLNIIELYESLPIKDRDDIDIDFFDICSVIDVNDQMIGVIYNDIEKKIVYGELCNDKSVLLDYIINTYKVS